MTRLALCLCGRYKSPAIPVKFTLERSQIFCEPFLLARFLKTEQSLWNKRTECICWFNSKVLHCVFPLSPTSSFINTRQAWNGFLMITLKLYIYSIRSQCPLPISLKGKARRSLSLCSPTNIISLTVSSLLFYLSSPSENRFSNSQNTCHSCHHCRRWSSTSLLWS